MNVAQLLIVGGGLLSAVSVSWLVVACRPGRGDRVLAALQAAIPLFVFLLPVAILIGAKNHCEDWDAARLCAAIAWAKGFPVYAGLNEGAIQTSMYPPGWLLAYAPAALARTPAGALQLGNLLAVCYYALPCLFASWLLGVPRRAVLFVLGAALFIATQVEPLWWACFSPHADAPALGFGLLAVLLLRKAEHAPAAHLRWLAAAAACAGLAVWSKQVMVPLLPALVFWFLLQRAPRRAGQFVALLAAAGAVLALISLCFASPATLWLNLVTIPGHHPWKGTFPFNILKTILDIVQLALPALILLVVNAVLAAGLLPRGAFVPWWRGSAWAPALLAAILLVPMSAMGLVKEGGATNSLAPALYFFYMAAVLQGLEIWSAARRAPADPRLPAMLTAGAAMMAWLIGGFWMAQSLQELRYGLHDFHRNLCHKAYAYLAADNRPRAYFPAYPLAHLLAEGRLYHFVHGMADRDQAGRVPIGAAQLAAHVPADAAIVCWTARQFGSEHGRGHGYFPAFTKPRRVPDLPDFRCFARGANEEAAAP